MSNPGEAKLSYISETITSAAAQGIELDSGDVIILSEMIRRSEGRCLQRVSHNATVWEVEYKGRKLHVLYNRRQKIVQEVMPPDQAAFQLPDWVSFTEGEMVYIGKIVAIVPANGDMAAKLASGAFERAGWDTSRIRVEFRPRGQKSYVVGCKIEGKMCALWPATSTLRRYKREAVHAS